MSNEKNPEMTDIQFDDITETVDASENDELDISFDEFSNDGFDFEPAKNVGETTGFSAETTGFANGFPQWDLLPPERRR